MTDQLADKRIVILGLARQGKALARFAAGVGADVVVSDLRSDADLNAELNEMTDLSVETVLGEHPIRLLDNADLLAISGGVPSDLPIVQAAYDLGIPVTNDSLEFMKRVSATVVGITGSAGKTTTTALTGTMIQTTGRRTWVGGNIGQPLITKLDQMKEEDVVVQELSSFQLEQWTVSPQVAAVLNITPNHLDRHKTMAAYSNAKANILRHQGPDDIALLSADDAGAMALRRLVRGRLRTFSGTKVVDDGSFVRDGEIRLRDTEVEKSICQVSEIPLRGWHNVMNVLAATVLADSVGVSNDACRQAIVNFKSVEHRLELVRTIKGVQFINDSIATAPERAIAALDSFTEPLVLLAGGRDKDMVWDAWASRVQERVKIVILFGDLAEQLEIKLLAQGNGHGSSLVVHRVETLEDAVALSAQEAKPGDVVLLAPGGTSFDAYVDFAERGEVFRELVNRLSD